MRLVHFGVIMGIIALPILGYFLMVGLVQVFPSSTSGATIALVQFAIIALGLAIPYWMLKGTMFEVDHDHKDHGQFKITDIPTPRHSGGKEDLERGAY